MRQRVTRGLREIGAIAVENPVLPGTPDVNYVEGWIELKWLRSWPVQGGVVSIPHFTPQQKVWHYKRRRAGGNSWFLLQCRREWILLDGAVAAKVINKLTREELIDAGAYWHGMMWHELIQHLVQRQGPYVFTPSDIKAMRG